MNEEKEINTTVLGAGAAGLLIFGLGLLLWGVIVGIAAWVLG